MTPGHATLNKKAIKLGHLLAESALVFDSRETRKTSEPVYVILTLKDQTLLKTFLFCFHCFLVVLEASTENLGVI